MELGFEDAGDCGGAALPLLCLRLESFATSRGKAVVLGAAIVFGGAPIRLHVTGAFHAAESREERTGVYSKDAAADLLDAESNTVAVHGLERECFENQHFERALDEFAIGVGFGHFGSPLDNLEYPAYEASVDCQEESDRDARQVDCGSGNLSGM
jgi:hypothetical protein